MLMDLVHSMSGIGQKGGEPLFLPCTPKGIMHLFEKSKIDLEGKDVVVLGRSDIVGKPIARLLTKANANVTVVHSKHH